MCQVPEVHTGMQEEAGPLLNVLIFFQLHG